MDHSPVFVLTDNHGRSSTTSTNDNRLPQVSSAGALAPSGRQGTSAAVPRPNVLGETFTGVRRF